jgi:hypothetical protein
MRIMIDLQGPNACGKTQLLNEIEGLLRAKGFLCTQKTGAGKRLLTGMTKKDYNYCTLKEIE